MTQPAGKPIYAMIWLSGQVPVPYMMKLAGGFAREKADMAEARA